MAHEIGTGFGRAAVVVAAGREVQQVPVGLDRWREVRDQAADVVAVESGALLFTRDAVGFGEWNKRSEESVTVSGEVDGEGVAGVLARASALAASHEQDAVAVTVGLTVLAGADGDTGAVLRDLAQRFRYLAQLVEEQAGA